MTKKTDANIENQRKFWFRAWIHRKGQRIERSGAINAKQVQNALAVVAHMAIDIWKEPLLKIEIYEMKGGGELCPAATAKDRINCVLLTHKQLKSERYKNIDARKKLAVEAGYPSPYEKSRQDRIRHVLEKGKVDKNNFENNIIEKDGKEDIDCTEWTWATRVGTYFNAQSFPTLKLDSLTFS